LLYIGKNFWNIAKPSLLKIFFKQNGKVLLYIGKNFWNIAKPSLLKIFFKQNGKVLR